MKPNAYQIREALVRASLMVDPETGEFTDEAEVIFAEVDKKAPVAVDIYSKIKANAEVEALGLKGAIVGLENEIKRLKASIAEREKTVGRMVGRIRTVLESTGEDKIVGETFTAQFAKVAPKVGDVDESRLPADYWVDIPASKRVDRKALLAALKAGEVPGATIITGQRRVTIK